MADRVTRVDDLDDTLEATERIVFSVRGQDYQIDLTEDHAREFDEALERFVNAAAKLQPPSQPVVQSGRGRRRQTGGGSGRPNIPEIRQWAQANGYDVSERGRIKKEILDKYDEAHQ